MMESMYYYFARRAAVFHFLEANLLILIIEWSSRLRGASQQKVKRKTNFASSASRAQRAVKVFKPQAG